METSLTRWTREYLEDARDSGAIDNDVSDTILEREAQRLQMLLFQMASSFVDNDFSDRA